MVILYMHIMLKLLRYADIIRSRNVSRADLVVSQCLMSLVAISCGSRNSFLRAAGLDLTNFAFYAMLAKLAIRSNIYKHLKAL